MYGWIIVSVFIVRWILKYQLHKNNFLDVSIVYGIIDLWSHSELLEKYSQCKSGEEVIRTQQEWLEQERWKAEQRKEGELC